MYDIKEKLKVEFNYNTTSLVLLQGSRRKQII